MLCNNVSCFLKSEHLVPNLLAFAIGIFSYLKNHFGRSSSVTSFQALTDRDFDLFLINFNSNISTFWSRVFQPFSTRGTFGTLLSVWRNLGTQNSANLRILTKPCKELAEPRVLLYYSQVEKHCSKVLFRFHFTIPWRLCWVTSVRKLYYSSESIKTAKNVIKLFEFIF